MSGEVVASALNVEQRERTPSGDRTFSSDALHGSDSSATMPSEDENFGRSVTIQLKLLNNGMKTLNDGMKTLNDRMENLDKKMKFCTVSSIVFNLTND
jgi:hypothetical protein